MKTFKRMAICLIALASIVLGASISFAQDNKKYKNFVYLDTKYGRTIIQLKPKLAPKHVERVKKLIKEGFYDGLKFHRVMEGFMAQTGDPTGTGSGGSNLPDLKAEFTRTAFNRGTIGAARTQNPHSANSQFFICFAAAPFLNGQYTVWGQVVHGMEYIDKIKRGVPGSGAVKDPDIIKSMTLVSATSEKPPVSLDQFMRQKVKTPGRGVLVK